MQVSLPFPITSQFSKHELSEEKYARLKSIRTCRRKFLSPTSTKRANRIALEENINAEILAQMQAVFDQADKDGGGFLDIDEFVDAFLGVLSTRDGSDELALRKLFMRVDVNSDNVLDWNEFLTFMLLDKEHSNQNEEAEKGRTFDLSTTQPMISDKNVNILFETHRDLITSITKIPPGAGSLYITTSKDGGVAAWNIKDMSLWKIFRQDNGWITCSAFLPHSKKLAVADFTRCIKIYECPNFYLNGCIQDLPYAPLCMTAWKQQNHQDAEFVCLGDIAGNVMVYEVKSTLAERKNPDQFLHKLKWQRKLHSDMVTSIKYVEELNSLITASTDSSLAIMDIEHRTPLKRLVGHSKCVNTCDWSCFYKFVCSGSQDRTVILWNPFSQRPLASLAGHTAPVLSISVHDSRNTLISLSTDKSIRVWDIRNHSCLQTIFDKEPYHPHDVLNSMLFDHTQERLLCGNRRFKVWDMLVANQLQDQYHRHTIVSVLYNPVFHEVLSGDANGTVCVWNLEERTFRSKFAQTHGNCALTSMAFDPHFRRLLTAAEDGTCKLWNFSNGSCLKTFSLSCKADISSALCLKLGGKIKIVVGAWDKQVTLFDDEDTKQMTPSAVFAGHSADIVSLTPADQLHILASGDCEGYIFIWNTDTWTVKQKLSPPETSIETPGLFAIIKVCFLKGRFRHILVALDAQGSLKAWHALEATLLSICKLNNNPTTMSVHHSTAQIAVGCEDGSLQILELVNNTVEKMNEWRVGEESISSIEWVIVDDSLLIGTLEFEIHQWTKDGCFIGVFGDLSVPRRKLEIRKEITRLEEEETEFCSLPENESDGEVPSSLW